MLVRSQLPPRAWRRLSLLCVVLLCLGLLAPLLGGQPAAAQIDDDVNNNGQPDQAFASAVDCIESGESQGLASEWSPRFAITCFKSSWNRISYEYPTGDPIGDAPASEGAVVGFGDGKPDQAGGREPGHTVLASVGTGGTPDGGVGVGAVYGLAYSSGTNPAAPGSTDPRHNARTSRTFTSAFHKRMTRFGTGGPGAIYVLAADGVEYQYVQVPDVVPGPNGVGGDPGDGSRATFINGSDASTYQHTMGGIHWQYEDEVGRNQVGKVGLGDIEIDPSEQYLVALNLNNKTVYIYDTWTNPPVLRWTVAVPSSVAGCVGGDTNFRPYTMTYGPNGDGFYVGYVCSGETTGNDNDLYAGVLRLPIGSATAWSRVLHFALAPFNAQRTGQPSHEWHAWSGNIDVRDPVTDAMYPRQQPLVAGLEFDEQGGLIIGLRSRVGDMSGTIDVNGYAIPMGDILRATPNGAGGWNAPVSSGAEYFVDRDPGILGDGLSAHNETSWGATTYIPGQRGGGWGGEVANVGITPYEAGSGGVFWYNVSGGQWTAREELQSPTAAFGFAKSAGLGDVELLCAWRAIGNRVWRDDNGNGLQDGTEPSINGVLLVLRDANGTERARLTTGDLNSGTDDYRFYVNPFQAYTISVDPSNFAAGRPLAGLSSVPANAGDDNLDNDAVSNGTAHVISVPAGLRGEINLSFDAGFTPTPTNANVRVSKACPANALPDDPITYVITYANDGPAPANGVQVTDTLPAGVTFVSSTPAPSSMSGTNPVWQLGTVPVGASGTISIQARTTVGARGNLGNTASISTSSPGNVAGDDSSLCNTTIITPDVYSSKTGPASVTVGQQLQYTITYGNQGTAAASNVVIRDTLPARTSFVSSTPAPTTSSNGVLTWNLGTVNAGASGTITLVVNSDATAADGSTLTNNVCIETNTTGNPTQNDCGDSSTRNDRANVRITKSSPTTFPVLSGQQVTYYLDYANTGAAAAANVRIVDTVPAQLRDVRWFQSGDQPVGVGNSIDVGVGTLAPGATGRITVVGTAITTVAREDFTNTATISTSTPETDTSDNTSSVPGAVWTLDVQITKVAQPQVTAGNTFTATLSYRNNGPAPASNVQVVDTLPAGVTFVNSQPQATNVSGSTLTWNVGSLADAQSGQIAVTLRSAPDLEDGAVLLNRATVTSPDPDRDGSNNSSEAQTVVNVAADLGIVKTGTDATTAGGDVNYTLTYRNDGPSLARGVTIVDTLPAEVEFVSATPAPASVTDGGVLTWNVGNLQPGAMGSIEIAARARTTLTEATQTATNVTTITSTTPDPNPDNNRDDHPTIITTPDIEVGKDMPDTIIAGVPFTATITVRNHGPAIAPGVVITDTVPSALLYRSATPAPSNVNGQVLTWNLGDMAVGAETIITVNLLAPADSLGGQMVNIAEGSTRGDRDITNNRDDEPGEVIPEADLSIVKDGTTGPILSGSEITYTLRYRNDGPSVARSVVVTDTPPAGFSFLSAEPAAANVSTNTGPNGVVTSAITWNVGDLQPGATGLITVKGKLVTREPTATLVNVATVQSPTRDPNGDNNRDDHPTIVETFDLSVTKDDDVPLVLPGGIVKYTLTVANAGPARALGVLLTDTLPAEVSLVSADPAPSTINRQTLTWRLGDMAANTQQVITVEVKVDAATPKGTVLLNRVVVDTPTTPTTPPNDSSDRDDHNDRDEEETPVGKLGEIGDFVWNDKNGDGVQGAGEAGIPGVVVQLLNPTTLAVIKEETTDANGEYCFEALQMGGYAVQISPAWMQNSEYRDYRTTTDPMPTATLSTALTDDMTLDIGIVDRASTDVTLASFTAGRQKDGTVLVRWETVDERDNSHFRIVRFDPAQDGGEPREVVVAEQVPSKGSAGAQYELFDKEAPEGNVVYWLVAVETTGKEDRYGPASVGPGLAGDGKFIVYLPLVRR